MTAEIAILNRTAVALAADSIVTLTGPLGSKTYDSAEKIFRLSRYDSIGVMIYNNAQILNAPVEVLVRRFRERVTSNQHRHLVDVWPAFEEFMLGFDHEAEDEQVNFLALLNDELDTIKGLVLAHMIDRVGRRRKKGEESAEALVARRIAERRIEAASKVLETPFLDDISDEAFIAAYLPLIAANCPKSIGSVEITAQLHLDLAHMMLTLVRSTIRSPAYTGLVFAGFGSDELFPTLCAVEIDGIYFGKVRVVNRQIVDIDRRGVTAAVVPFAQTEMPERFIHGLDRRTEGALEALAVSMVSNVVDDDGSGLDAQARSQAKDAARRQFREGVDNLKKRNANNLNAVVNHLSKKELGEIAYSLIELTWRKRRYSNEIESVGGPIDVAILTRNEGFIWVRRKKYFDPAMNPHYEPRK